jgi:arginyl-tRNA synthetase
VKLAALLDEAEQRAARLMESSELSVPAEQIPELAAAVGIGAVKYADLSQNRLSDYRFDWDKLVSFKGNAGPYLQYAHARICSIFARAGDLAHDVAGAPLSILEPAERALALMLLRYGSTVHSTAQALEPHRLCTYLYDLANAYSAFYQACPVLKADDASMRRSRLRLCDLTRRVLADGLAQLGIEAPQKM